MHEDRDQLAASLRRRRLVMDREERSGEQPLHELVRAVLRSTLEQLRSRQAVVLDG